MSHPLTHRLIMQPDARPSIPERPTGTKLPNSTHPTNSTWPPDLHVPAQETSTTRQARKLVAAAAADVEKQVLDQPEESTQSSTHKRWIGPLRCLFHLPDDQANWYHKTGGYCRYLESCFSSLLADEYSSVWRALGQPRPTCGADCWRLFGAGCAAIRTSNEGEECSIDNLWDGLLTDWASTPLPATTTVAAASATERDACHVALFSILCWATIAFRPRLGWEEFDGCPSLSVYTDSLDRHMQPINQAKRPAHAVFRQFRRAMTKTRWRHPIGDSIDSSKPRALEVSCLNYASLQSTAKIKLVWVSDITSHLNFDATNRRLFLFRFPAFCILGALAGATTATDTAFSELGQISPVLVR